MSLFVRCATALLVTAAVFGTIAPARAHAPADYRAERSHVRARARGQIGTPYRSAGSSPSGFDCSGFTRWVYSHIGVTLPHSSSAQYALGGTKNFVRIESREDLKVGDLVFHDTGSGGVGHAGMYVGDGKFISSTSSGGVRVESLSDGYWGPRWVGATRLPVTMRFRRANA